MRRQVALRFTGALSDTLRAKEKGDGRRWNRSGLLVFISKAILRYNISVNKALGILVSAKGRDVPLLPRDKQVCGRRFQGISDVDQNTWVMDYPNVGYSMTRQLTMDHRWAGAPAESAFAVI